MQDKFLQMFPHTHRWPERRSLIGPYAILVPKTQHVVMSLGDTWGAGLQVQGLSNLRVLFANTVKKVKIYCLLMPRKAGKNTPVKGVALYSIWIFFLYSYSVFPLTHALSFNSCLSGILPLFTPHAALKCSHTPFICIGWGQILACHNVNDQV